MTIRVVFEISPRDLQRFRAEMRRARRRVTGVATNEILAAAEKAFAAIAVDKAPDFIRERLPRLDTLIGMVRDEDWALPKSQRYKVLSVLAYFCDPDDLIPDVIPGLGLLDDAIMIELIFRDLHHDLEAFEDFRHYRETYYKRHKIGRDAMTRAARIKARRKELLARANRRKRRDREHGGEGVF
jgi:uncharacterized membrane protein YkvA (DUF1232 family)